MTHPQGACTRHTNPDLWFSDEPTDQQTAITICRACPWRTACQSYALDTHEPHGIWGGLTTEERHHINPPPRHTATKPTGTQQAPRNPHRDAEILRLTQLGWTAAMIANHLGDTTTNAIRKRRMRLRSETTEVAA